MLGQATSRFAAVEVEEGRYLLDPQDSEIGESLEAGGDPSGQRIEPLDNTDRIFLQNPLHDLSNVEVGQFDATAFGWEQRGGAEGQPMDAGHLSICPQAGDGMLGKRTRTHFHPKPTVQRKGGNSRVDRL